MSGSEKSPSSNDTPDYSDFDDIFDSYDDDNFDDEKTSKFYEDEEEAEATKERVLPFLTLNTLSEDEKSYIIGLSQFAINTMTRPAEGYDHEKTRGLEDALAYIVGESESWSDGTIVKKLQEARKLFSASLSDYINEHPYDNWTVYRNFYSASPNLNSYCGGLAGTLELLLIATRSNENSLCRNIFGEIVYDNSFDSGNSFKKILSEAEPIQQMNYLPIMYLISQGCHVDSWSSSTLRKIYSAITSCQNNEKTAPLVKIIANTFSNKLDNQISDELGEWRELDPSDPDDAMLIAEDQTRRERAQQEYNTEQDKLHQEFTTFSEDQPLVKIAPGIAANINHGQFIDVIANKNGDTLSLLQYTKNNPFDIDRKTAILLSAAHEPDTKQRISKQLGLDLSDIPLESQLQLLNFMIKSDSGRFDRLCFAMQNTSKENRLKLAEAFLATGFGEDFGDSLIDIAESKNFTPEEFGEILDSINSCRDSIGNITEIYKDFDNGNFASQYSRAANERLTDVLAVFRKIANSENETINLGWAGTVRPNYDKAIEALRYETKSLEIISGTISDVRNHEEGAYAEVVLAPDEFNARTIYNFYSPKHGYAIAYTRPYGAGRYDPSIEYGKKDAGVEASISLIANPIDPFTLINPFRPDYKQINDPQYYDHDRMDKVSAIRIDREGRPALASPNDPRRNPINKIGAVSVDLAAIGDRADTPSGKIARLISAGNSIRSRRRNAETSLNHNTNYFDQEKYGTSDGFEQLVNYIDGVFKSWCEEIPPKVDESYTGLKKIAKKRSRGRKALDIAS